PVLVDGAQSVAHLPVDVRELDCDFFVFSGHKLYGPTGIGVLYGKAALLEVMPPWQGGGDMIHSVTFAKTTYNVLPYKFEAGIPGTARASFALYNTVEEVDRFADALRDVVAGATARVHYSTAGAPVAFPPAAADGPEAAADELADVLEFLDDWPQRYQYILEL